MAGYIPEEKITEIRTAADIVDVLSESVRLKKSGRNFLGLCPFHSEKTPSFSVNRDKQIFHCFGCGVGGNVFTFLMRHDGLSFPEAVRQLARQYGIELPPPGGTVEQRRRYSEREQILGVNRRAADFYRAALQRGGPHRAAAAYLERRKMPGPVLEEFEIGFAPHGWDHLAAHLRQKKVPMALAEKAGLVLPRKSGDGYYDRFRNRIVFPIHDLSGRVIGFGGRVLDDALPKYLNSAESPVYQKSRSLYGIHQARNHCRRENAVYVVEGYFDVLSLVMSGVRHSVATLGTSMTSDHVRLLRGLVGEAGQVVLVYDSDEAGIRAAERSVHVFDKEFVNAKIMVLPSGHDPDSFVLEQGAARFERLAASAPGHIDFLMTTAEKKHGLSVEGKVRIVGEMAGPLSAVSDPVKRSLHVKALSERLGIQEEALLERVRQQKSHRPGRSPQGGGGEKRSAPERRLEKKVVAMMLQFPEILQEAAECRVLDFLQDPMLKRIGGCILSRRETAPVEPADIMAEIADSEEILAALTIEDERWTLKDGRKLLSQLTRAGRTGRQDPLMEKIQAAEKKSDDDSLRRLLAEKQKQAVMRAKEKWALTHGEKGR